MSFVTGLPRVLLVWVLCALTACHTHKSPDASVDFEKHDVEVGNRHGVGFVYRPNGQASYTVVAQQSLPEWESRPFVQSLASFRQSCSKLKTQAQWQQVCMRAEQVNSHSDLDIKKFFERHFTAWQVNANGRAVGKFTGYYEPMLYGSLTLNAQAKFPIYGIPSDMVKAELPASLRGNAQARVVQTGLNSAVVGQTGNYLTNLKHFNANDSVLRGRIQGNEFVPYYSRHQINGGALNGKAEILAYVTDPVDLFYLHIQGSGKIMLPNGELMSVAYADNNGLPFNGIANYMVQRGYLARGQTSKKVIKNWLQHHPHKLAEVLAQNPRYIFYKRGKMGNPVGALGVPLTDGFSAAVDRKYIPMGAPIFVATTHPNTRQALNRLIMAQDVGSAIQGAVRVDFYWGTGDEAGETASKMNDEGSVWVLLPNGVLPQV